MKKNVKPLPFYATLFGLILLMAAPSQLSAQVVLHFSLDRLGSRLVRGMNPYFYRPLPPPPPDYRRDYRRDYYEEGYEDGRRDAEYRNYRDERSYYEAPQYDNSQYEYEEYSAEGQFVRRIPRQAEKFKMAGKPFYMHEGVFYKPVKKGFIIIPPPIGLRVKHVPPHSLRMQIDGLTYYEINDTWYLDVPSKRWFEIVPAPVNNSRKNQIRNYQDRREERRNSKYRRW